MIRNLESEKEMNFIATEIWNRYDFQKQIMPRIESKQGGSSGAYYPSEHIIRIRWNVWNKLPLAGKRMLMIHELYHSAGNHHSNLFLHAFDILTIELYKKVYGEDIHYAELRRIVLQTLN